MAAEHLTNFLIQPPRTLTWLTHNCALEYRSIAKLEIYCRFLHRCSYTLLLFKVLLNEAVMVGLNVQRNHSLSSFICRRPLPPDEMKNIIFSVFGEDMSTGVVTQVNIQVIH